MSKIEKVTDAVVFREFLGIKKSYNYSILALSFHDTETKPH